jgi:hypothetical protein
MSERLAPILAASHNTALRAARPQSSRLEHTLEELNVLANHSAHREKLAMAHSRGFSHALRKRWIRGEAKEGRCERSDIARRHEQASLLVDDSFRDSADVCC